MDHMAWQASFYHHHAWDVFGTKNFGLRLIRPENLEAVEWILTLHAGFQHGKCFLFNG